MSVGDIERPKKKGLKGLLGKLKSGRGRPRLTTTSPEPSTLRSDPTSVSATSSCSSLPSSGHSNYGKKVQSLGSGIAGKVELYHKKTTNECFAIKTFHHRETYESKDEYKRRCYKEYQIVQGLDHDHLLRAYKFITGSSSHRIVMEYAPYSLLKVIQVCRPDEMEVMCFFRQICDGVNFLHSKLIAHRDLKMENLVLDESGKVKIIDFGSAFIFGPNKNQAMGIVGTESLMSPEANKSLNYDSEANDVWSLGVLLYSMFNLNFPWKAARESDPEFNKFLKGDSGLKEQFPQVMKDLILQVLAVDPKNRIRMSDLMKEVSEKIPPHSMCSEKTHARTLRLCEKRLKISP